MKIKRKNKYIEIPLSLIIAILLIVLLLVFTLVDKNREKKEEAIANMSSEILGNESDLISFSIDPLTEVEGEMIATGSVKGGYFFEGNIVINILDENKKILKQGFGSAKTDWMTTDPVGFETALDFTSLSSGPAYIEIHNDNASGLPKNDKSILIPIIIK